MKVASFFSGIGGFDLGFERSGMEIIFQCEKDPFCQSVLQKHWPKIPLKKDINELNPEDIPSSELWCGGFPCQDLSSANQGKRLGLNGKRSGLFYKFADLIASQKPRPRWLVIENVPGLLNSSNGEDFRIVLSKLDELGYGVSWRVLDAKYFGTSQRRRRVFIVGSLGNLCSAEVLFEPGGTRIVDKARIGQKEVLAKQTGREIQGTDIYSIQHASINRKHTAGPQGKGYRNDGETWTLDSRGGTDAVCSTNDAYRVREITGVPPQLDRNRYRAIGNAVTVQIIEWIGRRILFVDNRYQNIF